MTTIKIDNIEYEIEDLTNESKAQLASIQFCDQEIQRLQALSAAMQTARLGYMKALQNELASQTMQGDKISFN